MSYSSKITNTTNAAKVISCVGNCYQACAKYCEISVGMMAVNVEKAEM